MIKDEKQHSQPFWARTSLKAEDTLEMVKFARFIVYKANSNQSNIDILK